MLCVRSKHTHKAWNEHFIAPRGQAAFIYGTAWKKDETKDLVKEALVAGFRCFDTAAQPKHYREELVGEALREAISDGIVKREQIYVSFNSQHHFVPGIRLMGMSRSKQNSQVQRVNGGTTCRTIPMPD